MDNLPAILRSFSCRAEHVLAVFIILDLCNDEVGRVVRCVVVVIR